MRVGKSAGTRTGGTAPGAVPGTTSPWGRRTLGEQKAVSSYADGIRNLGVSEQRKAEIVGNYRLSRERMQEYERPLCDVTRNLPDAGQAEKQRLFIMGQRVYGLRRRRSVDEVLDDLTARGGELVWTGVGLRPVMEVATWCLTSLGFEFDAAKLEERVRKEAESLGGTMSEVSNQKDEGGGMKVEATPGNDEVTKQAETARVAELTARVGEFLAGKLDSRAKAEELARDIVGLITSVEAKPAKGQRKAASARSELPESSLVNEPTGLDRFRKRNATAELRLALAGHQPIVKSVVVERLSRHTGFKALAEKFELTVDEVTDILTQMREWVRRFTQFYENDWYWLDTAAKYHIPDPPKCEAEFKAAGGS